MATNKPCIEIPNRLKSLNNSDDPAIAHIVAGADDVYDDSQGRKQNIVNADVARHEAEINDPTNGLQKRVDDIEAMSQIGDTPVETDAGNIISNTSLSGKVPSASAVNGVYNALDAQTGYYTCDTAGGEAAKTVAAPGFVLSNGGSVKIKMTNANSVSNATLNINSTGAKALYYDGERAGSSNTWEDGETIEVYYDGTSYYANNVAGGSSDGVFDLTAKTGDTYATLSDALTAANTAIPANKKKGGMTVKYVRTSDNKYVQARCMAQNFTTDVTQWQGVDDEPTAGSKNLAESGGVLSNSVNISFAGKGNTFVSVDLKSLISGNKYRVFLNNPSHSTITQSGSSWLFDVCSYANETKTRLAGVRTTAELPNYLDFTVPSDSDYISIGGRCDVGEKYVCNIINITAIEEYVNNEKNRAENIEQKLQRSIMQVNCIGNNNITVDNYLDCLIPGKTYRVFTNKPSHANVPQASNVWLFTINSYVGENFSIIYGVRTNGEYPDYVDITIPADSEKIRITVRADLNEKVVCDIVDIGLIVTTVDEQVIPTTKAQFTGNDGGFVSSAYFTLKAGKTYIVFIDDWDYTNITPSSSSWGLQINSYDSIDTLTRLVGVRTTTLPNNSYIITVPSDSVKMNVGGRLTKDKVAKFWFVDATYLNDYADELINKVNDNKKCVNYNDGMSIILHRGYHYNNVPENSVDAFAFAGKLGYDMAENDVRKTSDGHYVIMHDESINRTCRNASDYTELSSTVNVVDITLEELRSNYVLASANPQYRKPVPTLEEYFETCKSYNIFPWCEIKRPDMTNTDIANIYNIGCKIMGKDKFALFSFSYEYLDFARTLSPNLLLGYMGTDILDTVSTVDGSSRENPNNIWNPIIKDDQSYTHGLTKEKVDNYHLKGMKVFAWICDAENYNYAIMLNLDGITVNYAAPNISNTALVKSNEFGTDDFVITGTTDGNIINLTDGQSISCTFKTSSNITAIYLRMQAKGTLTFGGKLSGTCVNNELSEIKLRAFSADLNYVQVTITSTGNSIINIIEVGVIPM